MKRDTVVENVGSSGDNVLEEFQSDKNESGESIGNLLGEQQENKRGKNEQSEVASVFVSYSSSEKNIAVRVCEYLEQYGIRCWIAPRNVVAGSNYATQIVKAIRNCSVLVLLASDGTNASRHVSNEVSIAFDNKKVIIPFKIEDVTFNDEYMYFLGRKHWIEAHRDMDKGLDILKNTVLSLLGIKEQTNVNQKPNREKQMVMQTIDMQVSKVDDITRDEIVDSLIRKSIKYPYNIYGKINTEELYRSFLENAMVLFQETITAYKQNRVVKNIPDLIELVVNELSKNTEISIPVLGLPGSAKNMFLQMAFYRMLYEFRMGRSDKLPVYISASYYEKLSYKAEDVQGQMKEILEKELEDYFDYIENNTNIKPVLFIEAIREHNVSKVSPEKVVFDLWKRFPKYSRICAMDVGLIKNRARLKRVIPIIGDVKGYTFVTNQVPIDDKNTSLKVIESIFKIYEYDLSASETYETMRNLKFPAIDIFLVRMVAKEMRSSYGYNEIGLIDVYEKLALSELYGDEAQLRRVSEELYEYVFVQSYNINTVTYNGALWSLPHKHNTYLEFLIAYYFVNHIENYEESNDYAFFGTILTDMTNHFVVSFLKDNYILQETFLRFITDNYEIFNVRQKCNAVYWLGRITYQNLSTEAVMLLTKEFTKYKGLVKTNNKNTKENCDNHFIFRAICTGLLFQGQANIMDEYLCIVVTNDIANVMNRGATIEYFGDNYQMLAHDAYYMDSDLNIGEQTIKILNSRIESSLKGKAGRFVENNLVTMLTLLQARVQNKRINLKFDIVPYVKKAIEYLSIYETRPQNIVSSKLMFYFQSVKEDLQKYLRDDSFDIGPMIYNQYRELKNVKRSQWVTNDIDDPESISEHTLSVWLMAMLFLPEEHPSEGYCKREILDMLLIHDMAEAVIGDKETSLSEPKKELREQNNVLRKLFLKGTYPEIANMTHYYNVWTGYYNGLNTNARTARDLNLLQSVYTFCEYYCAYPEHFSKTDVERWLMEKHNLKTEIGYQLYDRLITNNHDFKEIFECLNK